jgi:hypothetical protein
VIFESDSKLLCIDNSAFVSCSSLSSILIPSSVGQLCERCFGDCQVLRQVTFESGSRLAFLGPSAFWNCS